LQKQIGAAYYALKVALQSTPEKREKVVDDLLNATCFQMNPKRREEISRMIRTACSNYMCSPQKYWELFTEVDAACWLGLVSAAKIN